MSYKVLIPKDISSPGKEYLLNCGYELLILTDSSPENICANIKDCDAILGRLGKYPRSIFEAGNKLKILAKHGVGTDDVDLEAAKEYGVIFS